MTQKLLLELGKCKVTLTSAGAAILSIEFPDRNGDMDDVVLGHPTEEEYLKDSSGSYFGCIVGRVANRINQATFTMPESGEVIALEANNPPHALHGGSSHWGRQQWLVQRDESSNAECPSVTFSLESPDGDAGYPGVVQVHVTYSLELSTQSTDTDANVLPVLKVRMGATTSKVTPINMVQHTHWNLAGAKQVAQGCTVASHQLKLASGHYTPVDNTLIPTGEIKTTSGSALDFQGALVELTSFLSSLPEGIDHNFVVEACGTENLDRASEPGGMLKPVSPVANLFDPASGRGIEMSSNAPGLQVYTGNFLDGVPGKAGVVYSKRQSICLESQTFPDSVHQARFPSPFVWPGQVYAHHMDYKFYIS